MPHFSLRRERPLSEEEWARLPRGAEVISDGSDLVVTADINGSTLDLIAFAAALARAVPDARFLVSQPAQSMEVSAGASLSSLKVEAAPRETVTAAPADVPADTALLKEDPWELLDAGDAERAEKRFAAGYALDMAGRDRTREMFHSTDPEECAFACRIAGYTGWKSFVHTMRRVLEHGDVRVRRDAAAAIGKLAGPALTPALEERLNDPSPEVRAAVKGALAQLKARER